MASAVWLQMLFGFKYFSVLKLAHYLWKIVLHISYLPVVISNFQIIMKKFIHVGRAIAEPVTERGCEFG
jgi:hypothetical protein